MSFHHVHASTLSFLSLPHLMAFFFLLVTNNFFPVVFSKNIGGHFETWNTGILGPIALHGLDKGKLDLSWQKWTYQVA